jgi:F0F1-type ATP synthase membrane subunit b/b'
MSFRSEAEQLITARRIANLRDDAEAAEVIAFIARMKAETEALIEASRERLKSRLRQIAAENDDVQHDYDQEMEWGWTMDSGKEFP